MPRIKELEAAWKAHDLQNDGMHDLDCDKRPGWNNALGHSRFNAGCKAWVAEYIIKNPIPRVAGAAPAAPLPKKACVHCHKLVREDRLFEESLFGELVCSQKCANRYASKHMNERDAMVQDEIVKKIAATGERPRKATPDEPKPIKVETAPAGPVVVAAPSPAPPRIDTVFSTSTPVDVTSGGPPASIKELKISPTPETPLNPTPVPLPLLPEPLAPPPEPHFESPFTPVEEPANTATEPAQADAQSLKTAPPPAAPAAVSAPKPIQPAPQQTDQTANNQ